MIGSNGIEGGHGPTTIPLQRALSSRLHRSHAGRSLPTASRHGVLPPCPGRPGSQCIVSGPRFSGPRLGRAAFRSRPATAPVGPRAAAVCGGVLRIVPRSRDDRRGPARLRSADRRRRHARNDRAIVSKSRRPRPWRDDTVMAGFYIQNNAGISLQCFAWGLVFGLGSLYECLSNGIILARSSDTWRRRCCGELLDIRDVTGPVQTLGGRSLRRGRFCRPRLRAHRHAGTDKARFAPSRGDQRTADGRRRGAPVRPRGLRGRLYLAFSIALRRQGGCRCGLYRDPGGLPHAGRKTTSRRSHDGMILDSLSGEPFGRRSDSGRNSRAVVSGDPRPDRRGNPAHPVPIVLASAAGLLPCWGILNVWLSEAEASFSASWGLVVLDFSSCPSSSWFPGRRRSCPLSWASSCLAGGRQRVGFSSPWIKSLPF